MTATPLIIRSNAELGQNLGTIEQLGKRAADVIWQSLEDGAPAASTSERKRLAALLAGAFSKLLIDDQCADAPDAPHIAFVGAVEDNLELGDAPFRECDDTIDAAADAIRCINARLSRLGLKLRDAEELKYPLSELLDNQAVVQADV